MAYQITRRGENLRKGPWFEEEDETLTAAVAVLGEKRWDALAKASGLRRSGKSCRLRWLNYLRPNLKHGEITEEEELIIVELHKHWGNKWAKIARRLPGRTDNEIKNYWRTHLKKRSTQVQEEQEEFSSAKSNARKDVFVPVCDHGITRITTDIENSHYGNSDDSSCAVNELSNISFGSSPYETRVSKWMSSCLSYEQSEMERHHSHGRDPLGLDSSFCYPSWSFEEERDESIWDCSSSFWS